MELAHPTASTLLGRISTRFRSVYGNFLTILLEEHLWGLALVLDEKAWLAVSALNSSQRCSKRSKSCWNRKGQMAWNCPKCQCSFHWKTTPHHKLYTWHNAVRQVQFSWQPPNPDSSIGLPDKCDLSLQRRLLH